MSINRISRFSADSVWLTVYEEDDFVDLAAYNVDQAAIAADQATQDGRLTDAEAAIIARVTTATYDTGQGAQDGRLDTLETDVGTLETDVAARVTTSTYNAGQATQDGRLTTLETDVATVAAAIPTITVRNNQSFVARKTDGDTTITSADAGSPTYVSGTYINLGSATYERIAHVTGIVASECTAGGATATREVSYWPAIQKDYAGGFVNDLYPVAVDMTNGLSAAQPRRTVVFDRIYTIPANEAWELRIYGRKNASGLTAVAKSTNTQLSALVVPVVPVVVS